MSKIEEFEELIKEHEKFAFNVAYRLSGNIEDAKDIAQEAFIKAYRNFEKFEGKSKFSTWLYAIINNTAIDYIKKKNKITNLEDERFVSSQEGAYDIVEREVEKNEIKKLIHDAINQLPPAHRQVVVLRDMQNLSYEEIGTILNCSIGTVKSRISRGRDILRKIIVGKEVSV